MSDASTKTNLRHSECGRQSLYDAAAELSHLLACGTILPAGLRMQIAATVTGLVAEANAKQEPAND